MNGFAAKQIGRQYVGQRLIGGHNNTFTASFTDFVAQMQHVSLKTGLIGLFDPGKIDFQRWNFLFEINELAIASQIKSNFFGSDDLKHDHVVAARTQIF